MYVQQNTNYSNNFLLSCTVGNQGVNTSFAVSMLEISSCHFLSVRLHNNIFSFKKVPHLFYLQSSPFLWPPPLTLPAQHKDTWSNYQKQLCEKINIPLKSNSAESHAPPPLNVKWTVNESGQRMLPVFTAEESLMYSIRGNVEQSHLHHYGQNEQHKHFLINLFIYFRWWSLIPSTRRLSNGSGKLEMCMVQ